MNEKEPHEEGILRTFKKQNEIYSKLKPLLQTDLSPEQIDLMFNVARAREKTSLQTYYLFKIFNALESIGKDALRVKTV